MALARILPKTEALPEVRTYECGKCKKVITIERWGRCKAEKERATSRSKGLVTVALHTSSAIMHRPPALAGGGVPTFYRSVRGRGRDIAPRLRGSGRRHLLTSLARRE